MKFYLISDNVDTEMGLRLVGIEGEVVHKRRDFLEVLETKMKDRSCLLYTSPSPRDSPSSRMPSSA